MMAILTHDQSNHELNSNYSDFWPTTNTRNNGDFEWFVCRAH